MDFSSFQEIFQSTIGARKSPNEHEKKLFQKAQKYIIPLIHIPGVEMIAIGNSLAMYATHDDSDIDLFIVTRSGYLWFVRVIITGIFWILGVWRKGDDIAENFCLSFFVTTKALEFEKIAIQNDIYLFYWIYFLKPIVTRGMIYDDFLDANTWVKIPEAQKQENLSHNHAFKEKKPMLEMLWKTCDQIFYFLFSRKTEKRNEQLAHPKGVIISEDMLKFHVKDRREAIRDRIFMSNL